MRRKDREITDINQILELLDKTQILRLGLNDDTYPYIVPLHYGYEITDDKLTFYMHSAKEGFKLDLIRRNSFATIELDNDVNLVSGGEIPCEYGSSFSSIIARGNVAIIDDVNDKIHGLKVLMKQQTGKDFEFDEKMASSVAVIKFVSDTYTAKARKMPK